MRKMFSEKQIKKLAVEGLENESSLNFSGDLKVKSLEQSDYNWAIDLPLFTELTTLGLTQTRIFAKLVEINKVLYVVFELDLANETESSITISSNVYYSEDITLPSEIANKIYDNYGNKVSANDYGEVVSSTMRNGKYNVVASNGHDYTWIMQHHGANKIRLAISGFGSENITITNGSSDALHARTFIVL